MTVLYSRISPYIPVGPVVFKLVSYISTIFVMIDPKMMTIDPKMMTIDQKIMTIDPKIMTIDPKILRIF